MRCRLPVSRMEDKEFCRCPGGRLGHPPEPGACRLSPMVALPQAAAFCTTVMPKSTKSRRTFRARGASEADEPQAMKQNPIRLTTAHSWSRTAKVPLMRRAPTGGLLANREVEVTPLEIDMPSKLDPRLFTVDGLDLPVGAQIRDNVSGSKYGRRMGGQGGRAAGWSCGPRRRRSPRRLLASRGLAAVFRRRGEAPSCFRLSSLQFSNTRP